MSTRMPVIFFGHGNPMNTILKNEYTAAWSDLGKKLPKPKAILSISAHWYVRGVSLTSMTDPRTIHDFGGFPEELYQFEYPVPGDPKLARRIQKILSFIPARLDTDWGLDHGTWSVLSHVFPKADVPVVQLSIDECRPALFHYELGKKLSQLRDEGILVIGSGNLVHNLHTYSWGRHQPQPYDWAVRFEERVRKLILAGGHKPLINYETLGQDAALSIPTPDHYLPLLYVLGISEKGESVEFPAEGIDGGSISMLAVKIGGMGGKKNQEDI
jgi:4,5-DOPA dioxygenase extradiol